MADRHRPCLVEEGYALLCSDSTTEPACEGEVLVPSDSESVILDIFSDDVRPSTSKELEYQCQHGVVFMSDAAGQDAARPVDTLL